MSLLSNKVTFLRLKNIVLKLNLTQSLVDYLNMDIWGK